MIEFIKKTPFKVACLVVSYLFYVQIFESFLIVLDTDEVGKFAMRVVAGGIFVLIIASCFKHELLERIRKASNQE